MQKSQEQSRRQRAPDEPPGGAWHASAQPRVKVDDVVDETTAHVVDYYLGPPMDVSRQLLRSDKTVLNAMQLMCSAVWDHGATDWHRDYCSNNLTPLAGARGERPRLRTVEHRPLRRRHLLGGAEEPSRA